MNRKYIPALSLKWLTPFYDSLVEGPVSMMRMRKNLLATMGDLNGKAILDIGSGTGSLSILIKQTFPDAQVTGLDGDPQILEIARSKAISEGIKIDFKQGMSFELPFPDASFDLVLTSFMLHHLDRDAKQKTALEAYRILRTDGRLFGIDFVEPRTFSGKVIRPLVRHGERIADHMDGFLPVMFREAGFKDYLETHPYLLGIISSFQTSRD